MGWMSTVTDFWLTTLAWVTGLTVAFALLVRLTPCNPGFYWWKNLRGAATDFFYWFVVPLFLRLCRTFMVVAGVALLFGGHEPDCLPVQGWPIWVQCLAVLVLQDVMLYWIHRAFHTPFAWKFHAIHHSPEQLDWTATARFHPINNLLAFSLADVTILLLGFCPLTLVYLTPFNVIYSAMVHANLNWTFGPLRHIFASPVFHRWHHTTEAEGLDKNFASTFPILDLLFGTFYMPAGKLPQVFGTGEPDFPEGFLGQFLHPFWSSEPQPRTLGARALCWGRRLAAVGIIAILAVVTVVGGSLQLHAWQAQQAQARAEPAENAEPEAHSPGESASTMHAIQLDRALRAWTGNDLVQATAILDAVPAQFQQTPQQHYLRDLCRSKCLPLKGHAGPVLSVAVSGDGKVVVSGSADGTARIWDATTGQEKLTLTGHTGTVTAVAISADGQRVVTAGNDRTVKVWDVPTGQVLTLVGHVGPVLSAAISADGQRVVSGSADLTIKIWDAAEGQIERTLKGHTGAVTSVALSADGQCIASASWGAAKLWDATTGKEETGLPGPTESVYCVALSADGQHVVTGNNDTTVRLWDTPAASPHTLAGHAGPVYGVAICPTGPVVISGSADGTVKVWDRSGKEECALKGHTDSVTSVAVSADGRHIVSGSRDGTVKVWDIQRCKPPKTLVTEACAGSR